MLETIKKMKNEGLKLMDQALSAYEISNMEEYRMKWAEGKVKCQLANELAKENNINLNNHVNKYGEWIS